MGTYTDFSVAGYPLLSSKSAVVPEVMTVFRETDKLVFERRLGDRNPLVWGDVYAKQAADVEQATTYTCGTDEAAARLDVMGFTLARARRDYDAARDSELSMYRELAQDDQHAYADELAELELLSFDTYLEALRFVMAEGLRPLPFKDHARAGLSPAVRHILEDHDERVLGYFGADIRGLVRVACEVATSQSLVVQDITDLVDGGYYNHDTPVCQNAIDFLARGHLDVANRIVLTEGATDAKVLEASLELLYPHLSGYYSFLDFDGARAPGGAGALVSLVKGFAAAGLGNRIIAVFDNDSAARDARRTLAGSRLPPNIAVISYPDLDVLRNYPTLGPNGPNIQDVNGLAAGLELYFGTDVLVDSDGNLTPVQWRGLIESLGTYQGEVVRKGDLQAAFLRKLTLARSDPALRGRQDWSGIDAILRAIFAVSGNDIIP